MINLCPDVHGTVVHHPTIDFFLDGYAIWKLIHIQYTQIYKHIFQTIHRGFNVTWGCFKHTRLEKISDLFSLNITSTWSLSLHLILHHKSSQLNFVTLKVLNSHWGPSISYVILWWHCISVYLYHANFHDYIFAIHQFKLNIGFYKHLAHLSSDQNGGHIEFDNFKLMSQMTAPTVFVNGFL